MILILLLLLAPGCLGSCMGHGLRPEPPAMPDADGDGTGDSADCAPEDAGIHPGSPEICDGIDQDCDGHIDWGAPGGPYYYDRDGDGFGDPTMEIQTCEAAPGYIADGSDCDDDRADISPAAPEVCDGLDNNCDGGVDLDAEDGQLWYPDLDLDGFGAGAPILSCGLEADRVANGADCDDTDAAVHPGAAEVCDDLDLDENCNQLADDADPTVDPATGLSCWLDSDGDGYGDAALDRWGCEPPADCVANDADCDDTDPARWRGAPGACE